MAADGRRTVGFTLSEGKETRMLAYGWDYSPAVPPKKNRKHLWKQGKE
jgi:hypothetical protein